MNQMERAQAARQRMDDLVADLYSGVLPGEVGDGDLWFVAAIHSPDMDPSQMVVFNSLSSGEGMAAATALTGHFREEVTAELNRLVACGFYEAEAVTFGHFLTARRHFPPDSKQAAIVAAIDAMSLSGDNTELLEMARNLYRELADDAARLAMADAANWGDINGEG